ncbi:flagellar hook protein FlgE [Pantoea sp. 18069]|uniref:flagellar hook protein FlgE n=1 Tax=Pantoea sp. 18069 TaxID=2681415 RepID=UPI00135C6732|nr:flagellar hook protein FlgE [Pantoea sp. 18069]
MGFQHGLSGLNAASKNLDVIGHNIANSSTTGFKSSRTDFAEMVASAIGSSSGSTSGIGVSVAAVSQQFTQGAINSTGNSLDLAVNGDGFFHVKLADGTQAYTRSGNFQLDKAGNLVTTDGASVMGYPIDPLTGLTSSTTLEALKFPTGQPIPAKETTQITAALNLNARAENAAGDPTATPPIPATPRATYGTSLEVYDSQGIAAPVTMYFEKTDGNTWNVFTSLDPAAAPVGQLIFDGSGKLVSGSPIAMTVAAADLPNPNVNGPNPVADLNITLNLSGVTQSSSDFAVSKLTHDGYAAGELNGIQISTDGTIMANYSNGVTRAESQLALAKFSNTQGLSSIGGNNWVATAESGTPLYGTAKSGSFGSMISGALESSNVDLTAELVNMMGAQRAYQANAQTIKTQDQVFSTLVNLR